jgi:hypothetical protein
MDLLGAPADRRREREVIGLERKLEDVIAVQAAHVIVREAGCEIGAARGGVDGTEKRGDAGDRFVRVSSASQGSVETFRVAEVFEYEDAFWLVEVNDSRADVLRIERPDDFEVTRFEDDTFCAGLVLRETFESGTCLLDDPRTSVISPGAPDPVDVPVPGRLDGDGVACTDDSE